MSPTSDNIPHAKSISGGQSAPPPNHEKGARDKNLETQDREEISQVGFGKKTESREQAAAGSYLLGNPPTRSLWFDDPQTKEIGAKPGSTGTIRGWVYVRTKTGHLRKRTSNRDSVSELHPSDSEQI
jgi:hypothetical protein